MTDFRLSRPIRLALQGLAAMNAPSGFTFGSPPPPPPPPPPPQAASNSYRLNNSRLFADVAATTPTTGNDASVFYATARASVAAPKSDYLLGTFGPSATYVEYAARWNWLNSGGDWINNAGVAQATTSPHVTFTANSVTSGSAAYTANILAGAQKALARGKWFALILRSSGSTRQIASLHHATLPAPSVSVSYNDGTTATLACLACVRLTTGTSYSLIGSNVATCGTVAIEFEMPSKPVTAATLNITMATHDSTPTTINGYLANPPVSTSPVTAGIAASYPGDEGITGHASVLFAQRYTDGTALSDYILTGITPNVFIKSDWDAGLWGGTDNVAKLPTAHAGTAVAGTHKWFYKQNTSSQLSIVPSTYTGEGFEPVAPGLGALKIVIPASTAADGGNAGYFGALGSDLWALFPKTISGTLNELYVRFKFRIASDPELLADTKMLRTETGAAASYAVAGGKWGVGGHHWTQFGGNDNQGGGSKGWSNRLKYTEFPADSPVSGYGLGIHAYDQLGSDFYWGKEGLGAGFYPDKWYDVEVRLRLNTWNGAGGSPADAICETWIDGKLDSTQTGFSYRDGPLDAARTASSSFSPFREIGFIGLCLNSYNGGVMAPDHDVTVFYANVVAGTSRVGPMTPPRPAWASVLSTTDTWHTLSHQSMYAWAAAGGVPAGAYRGSNPFKLVDSFSDPAYHPLTGDSYYFGGGHGDGTCNAVLRFDHFNLSWSLVGAPTPPSTYLPGWITDGLTAAKYYPSGKFFYGVAPYSGEIPPAGTNVYHLTAAEGLNPTTDAGYIAPALARVSTHMYGGATMDASGIITYTYSSYAEFDTKAGTWSQAAYYSSLATQLPNFNINYGNVPLQQGTQAIYDQVTDRHYITLNPGDAGGGWRSGLIQWNKNTRSIEAIYDYGSGSSYGLVLNSVALCVVGRELFMFQKPDGSFGTNQPMNTGTIFHLDNKTLHRFTVTGTTSTLNGTTYLEGTTGVETIPCCFDGRKIRRWNPTNGKHQQIHSIDPTVRTGAGTIGSPWVFTQTEQTVAGSIPPAGPGATETKYPYKRFEYYPAADAIMFLPNSDGVFRAIRLS